MQTPTTTQLRRYYQSGFTLIELLIVIAIIGILAAIAVPQYGNYLNRSAITACASELNSFRSVVLSENAIGVDLAQSAAISGFDFQACSVDAAGKTSLQNLFLQEGTSLTSIDVDTTNRNQEVTVNENGQIDTTT